MTGDHAVTAQRADAASAARKRFAAGKTLAEGQFICPEHVQSPKGGVSL